jgi:hypothetical protein
LLAISIEGRGKGKHGLEGAGIEKYARITRKWLWSGRRP